MIIKVRNRARRGVARMCADERTAFLAALDAACALSSPKERERMLDLVERVAAAVGRVDQRRTSNARTEGQRRKLVGARLRIEDAERCARCAGLLGVSMYRFAVDAFTAACERAELLAVEHSQR